jgi:hypothetical protein
MITIAKLLKKLTVFQANLGFIIAFAKTRRWSKGSTPQFPTLLPRAYNRSPSPNLLLDNHRHWPTLQDAAMNGDICTIISR